MYLFINNEDICQMLFPKISLKFKAQCCIGIDFLKGNTIYIINMQHYCKCSNTIPILGLVYYVMYVLYIEVRDYFAFGIF